MSPSALAGYRAHYLWVDVTVADGGPAELALLDNGAETSITPDSVIELACEPTGEGWMLRINDTRTPLSTGLAVAERAYGAVHDLVLDRARETGWTRIHGCLVECGDRLIAIVGQSGAGKTTLATALALAGVDVHGDDAFFARQGEVIALPRPFHIKDSGLGVDPRLRSVPSVTLDYDPPIVVVSPHHIAGLPPAVRSPRALDHLVVLAPRIEGESTIRPASTPDILSVMLDDLAPFAADRAQAMTALVAVLGRAETHVVQVGDVFSAVEIVRHLS